MNQKIYMGLYYERVSTDHDEQTESMENQRRLCLSYLKRHPEIHLAEPIDTYSERISGKNDVRPKYQKMLKRVSKGDIDYILVKDFKRMNRSSEVSAQLKNYAKKYKFKFILLSTSQIYDPNTGESRMMYGFESLMNEEVVYRQSEYGRLAHRQKCEAKRLNANDIRFGYKWDSIKKDIVIDEEQAVILRTLFDKYVFQNTGVADLRKYLSSLGIHYSAQTVSKWLQDSAYMGIFYLNKRGSELGVGIGQKTIRYENPKDEWVPVERPDLAIIETEIFELAQKIRESRIRLYDADKNGVAQARFRGRHLFSAKIYCNECKMPYVHGYADRKKMVGIYRDSFSHRRKNALEECENKDYRRVYEDDIKLIALASINGMIRENRQCFDMLLSVLDEVLHSSDNSSQLQVKKAELKKLSKKAEKTKSAYIEAAGALRSALAEDYELCNKNIEKIQNEIERLQNDRNSEEEIKKKLGEIRDYIDKWQVLSLDMLDRSTIEIFIKRIIIHKDGDVDVILNSSDIDHYNFLDMIKYEGNPTPGSPLVCQEIEYAYESEQYLSQIKNILRLVILENETEIQMRMLSYAMRSNRQGRHVKKQDFKVHVEIFIAMCS